MKRKTLAAFVAALFAGAAFAQTTTTPPSGAASTPPSGAATTPPSLGTTPPPSAVGTPPSSSPSGSTGSSISGAGTLPSRCVGMVGEQRERCIGQPGSPAGAGATTAPGATLPGSTLPDASGTRPSTGR